MLPASMLADNAPPFQCAQAADCIAFGRIFAECNSNYCTCIWRSLFWSTILPSLKLLQCNAPIDPIRLRVDNARHHHYRCTSTNKEFYYRRCLLICKWQQLKYEGGAENELLFVVHYRLWNSFEHLNYRQVPPVAHRSRKEGIWDEKALHSQNR